MKSIFHPVRILLLLASMALLESAAMADTQAFSPNAFDTLQKEGKPTLIAIHASWCPTCRSQAKTIDGLLAKPEYKTVTALRVDFDNQPKAMRYFKAPQQSVLIAYKSGKEVARSTGETNADAIEKLIQKTL